MGMPWEAEALMLPSLMAILTPKRRGARMDLAAAPTVASLLFAIGAKGSPLTRNPGPTLHRATIPALSVALIVPGGERVAVTVVPSLAPAIDARMQAGYRCIPDRQNLKEATHHSQWKSGTPRYTKLEPKQWAAYEQTPIALRSN